MLIQSFRLIVVDRHYTLIHSLRRCSHRETASHGPRTAISAGAGGADLDPLLSQADLIVLVIVTLLTSTLSAIVGMAGGITLLSVMMIFIAPLHAIPLHGVVQFVANGSRTYAQRRHVRWDLLARYALLAFPLGFVGLFVAKQIPPDLLKALIGVFVLLATWRPSLLLFGRHPEQSDPRRRFLVLGGVTGVLNVVIGTTGPLIAPFFLNLGLTRQGVVGTQAACQMAGHLAKVAVFVIGGFVLLPYAPLLALMIPAAVAGTWVGSRLLDRVDERRFKIVYKTILTVIALELVIEAL